MSDRSAVGASLHTKQASIRSSHTSKNRKNTRLNHHPRFYKCDFFRGMANWWVLSLWNIMSKTTNQSFQCHFRYEIEIYPVETPPSEARAIPQPFDPPLSSQLLLALWHFQPAANTCQHECHGIHKVLQHLTAIGGPTWPQPQPQPLRRRPPLLHHSDFGCGFILPGEGIPINTRKKLRNWAIWIGEIMIYHWILEYFGLVFQLVQTNPWFYDFICHIGTAGWTPDTPVTPLQWFQPLRHSTVAEGRRFLYLGPSFRSLKHYWGCLKVGQLQTSVVFSPLEFPYYEDLYGFMRYETEKSTQNIPPGRALLSHPSRRPYVGSPIFVGSRPARVKTGLMTGPMTGEADSSNLAACLTSDKYRNRMQ